MAFNDIHEGMSKEMEVLIIYLSNFIYETPMARKSLSNLLLYAFSSKFAVVLLTFVLPLIYLLDQSIYLLLGM